MQKYQLEFILSTYENSPDGFKNSIIEFGEDIKIVEVPDVSETKTKNFKINIRTQDPALIFDACAEFGRIKSVKIDEENINLK